MLLNPMKMEHRDAVRICIDNGRFRWRAKRKPEAKRHAGTARGAPKQLGLAGSSPCKPQRTYSPELLEAPSRKRSCPEPNDVTAFAAESSDSS